MDFTIVYDKAIPGAGLRKMIGEVAVPGGKIINITTISSKDGESTSDCAVFVPDVAVVKKGKEG